MKKMRVVLVTTALLFFSQCVFAHDGYIGDPCDPIQFPNLDTIEFVHDETLNNPGSEFKGWAFWGLQNTGTIAWTDFHIKLTTSDPAKPVIFVVDSPYEPLSSVNPFTYNLIDNDTQLNFDFPNDPVQPGSIVTFQVYTDNTAWENSTFTLCLTPTPEPATVALLGLGALLIRKRK
ncbi:MAG: PEP-CTERM sorting domain-containing protein [Sedimentisphaerales bacterium]|nr:PEP-CTERM sorting domain-containing protein [Sedimentisphaerales bacterium]